MTQRPSRVDSSRVLLVGAAALFAGSSLFPVAASVLRVDRPPKWVGAVDVVVALALVALGMFIVSRKPGEFTAAVVSSAFGIHRAFANTFLILLVLFFVAAESVRWSILLPGLAWRAWLLVMVLPSWLSLWQSEPREQGRDRVRDGQSRRLGGMDAGLTKGEKEKQ